jgi:putative transposase
VRFEFIKTHSNQFPVEKMAKVMGVSLCGYYDFLRKGASKRALENQCLIEKIKKIHKKSRGTYGSPRVHAELKNKGFLAQEKELESS